MEPAMRRSLSHFKAAPHYCTCVGSTRHRETIWCVLWCIRHGYWRSVNARWSCNCLCFVTASMPWRALPTHNLELLAVVHALKIWRHYLLGNLVYIYTDHKSLKYLFTQPDLNIRQQRWLKLIKDYELEVHYHPGKTNVVADAISRKHRCNHLTVRSHSSYCDSEEPSFWVILHVRWNNISLIPTIKEDIIATQRTDVGMGHLRQRLELGEGQCFQQDVDGVLWFKYRLVVPKDLEIRRKIMDEAHCSRYSIHPGTNKMYQDLKKNFWWTRMKREIAKYVSECDTCWRVKDNHLRPAWNLQLLSIPEWK
jgi:hypothetical protein